VLGVFALVFIFSRPAIIWFDSFSCFDDLSLAPQAFVRARLSVKINVIRKHFYEHQNR
jgi:hypothetical protein